MPLTLERKKKIVLPDWESLYQQFCTTDFIADDPIQFPHRYQTAGVSWQSVECVAFIAAMFSYGGRPQIIQTVENVLKPLGDLPHETLQDRSRAALRKTYQSIYYRFQTGQDIADFLDCLGQIYQQHGSLKQLWQEHTSGDLQNRLHQFRNLFFARQQRLSYGLGYLVPNAQTGSAVKRLHFFLRWMVRRDAVDLGLWQEVLNPAELIFPLDRHVGQMARFYQITDRKTDDWQTAEMITAYFRQRDPDDPVKYDFALFGLGVKKTKQTKLAC